MNRRGKHLKLTKKKLENKRFRKNEEAILMAIFSDCGNMDLNLGRIMKKIKISRTTFYRHHNSMGEILLEYEQYLISEFAKKVKNEVGIKNIFLQLLRFLLEHKNVVELSVDRDGGKIIERLIEIIDIEGITEKWEIMSRVCRKEMVGVIEVWIERGFKKEEIDEVFKKILFLLKTREERLDFLRKGLEK